MESDNIELCPLGYAIGGNGMTIAWDSAIEKGDWDELKNKFISVNIETLIRNAMESYEGDDSTQPGLDERIREDIDLFKAYLADVHDARMEVYRIDYDHLTVSKLPNYRVPKTDRQKDMDAKRKRVLRTLGDVIDKTYDRKVHESDYLVSHILLDMVTAPKSTRLIETHTGRIRSYGECNEKLNLTDGERLVVPFNTVTYLLYGEKQLFNKNTKVTKALLDVLLKGQITTLSTETRVNMCIKNNDPLLYKFIKDLLK